MSKAHGLLEIIGQDPALQSALEHMIVPGNGTLVSPSGLRPAISALAFAQKMREERRNSRSADIEDFTSGLLVVVTATSRQAERFAQTARAFMSGVEVFLPWETLPHERLSPQLDTMAKRVSILRRLTHLNEGEPLNLLVVPVRAFLQPVLWQIAEISPVTVQVGDLIDREKLVNDLVSLGYEATDLVERRGQVAVRGSIVDVYVPTNRFPLRIELFGDEVDEIRWFNLSDQRTIEDADKLFATPIRELLLSSEIRQKARELVSEYRAVADLLELAAEGIYAPGIESLSGLLGREVRPLTSLLPPGTIYLLDEPEQIAARSEDLQQTNAEFLQAAWGAAAAGGKIPLQLEQTSFCSLKDLWQSGKTDSWWKLTSLPPAKLAEALDDTQGAVVHELEQTLAAVNAREVAPYRGKISKASEEIDSWLKAGQQVVLFAPTQGAARRFQQIFTEADIPVQLCSQIDAASEIPPRVLTILPVAAGSGFTQSGGGYQLGNALTVLTEQDLTGRVGSLSREIRKMPTRRKKGLDSLSLHPGDYVVHEQHGIGRFVEITTREVVSRGQKSARDYLVIEYAASKRGQIADQLFVPTTSLDQVSKYVGSDEPKLSKMGGADWARTKQKARKAVRDIAAELVRLYAARQQSPGFAFSADTPWQRELEESFEYTETPDQLVTMDEVKADMEKPIPMDRLLTGDVGYGKTEIAVRAAFKAVQDAKQVAVLVPTTLLAQQHFETFTQRYAGFPVRVAQLSRFTAGKEVEKVKAGLLDGTVDVVIGTHALLTGTVRFKDLGLVIVDEEQRFGVEHKETLKAMRTNVDVLSMSATPIPRTLEMAVAGIREMSVLQTPPEDRQPVLTFVGGFEDAQVGAAIRRELLREGQVFYVHNRVDSINRVAAHIQELVPEARIRVAHGRLSEAELERVIIDFWNHEFDVLVSTTIVETGLDISNANTLIVDRADMFGLSQLHQLRGRVGRGQDRAYAYFFYPKEKTLSETALERLRTIAANTDLGAGIAIAQKDLEIRGAGNLLGGAQSGHIEGVGFDLYVRMVGDAVAEYKGEKPVEKNDVRIELAVDAHLPEEYVPSERLRLEVYAKIAAIVSVEQEMDLRSELEDRYGPLPLQVERLFLVQNLRRRLRQVGISEVFTQGNYVRFSPVELADSQVLRLKRLHPGSVIKPAVRQVLVPLSKPNRLGQSAPTEEALVKWVLDIVENIIVPFGSSRRSNIA